MKNSKVSYILTDSKFTKLPLSCLGGFLQGITISPSCDFNVIRSVNVYGDMATVEWCSAIMVEE